MPDAAGPSRGHGPDAPSGPTAPAGPSPSPGALAESEAALERERWLRSHIDKDHELLLLVGRTVVGALAREPSALRFWRWLIDDLRSERRDQAALLTGQRDEGLLPRLRRWLRPRRGAMDAADRPV